MSYDQINLMGLEIEGYWQSMPPVGALDYDGSVEFPVGEPPDYPIVPDAPPRTGSGVLGETIDTDGPLIGEAVSEPLPPNQAVAWLEDNYPYTVNSTCGLHIHFSFPAPNYQLLMDDGFYDLFMEQLWGWGEDNPVPDQFWNRINGHNTTCRDEWDPDRQIQSGHDARYTIWNFQAFRSHGTAECRVLPAFEDVELAQEAVLFVTDTVCEYLRGREPEPVTFSVNPERSTPTTKELT